jgi:hypothetical protein
VKCHAGWPGPERDIFLDDRLAGLEFLAKIAAAATLFAYLLRRGGVRPAAVTTVIVAQLMALFCVMPAPAELVFVSMITLGICTYAILAVDRLWIWMAIVVACAITFGALLAQAMGGLFVVGMVPLAFWIGFMAVIREWARIGRKSKPGVGQEFSARNP